MPRRTRHPGVVLVRPKASTGRTTWRARYKDPDTERTVWVTLDPVALRTGEQRLRWAVDKSRDLAKRRALLQNGAPRATGMSVGDGMKNYFEAHSHLRARTLVGYRNAADKFVRWATRAGIDTLDDLTRAHLVTFRDALIKQPKHSSVPFGRRGQTAQGATRRSAHSVNRDLRATRTMLGYLCERDLLPRLTHDDLRRALKRTKADHDAIEFLRPHELQQLLQAALRHDAATFKETRDEHAGCRRVGTTPCYEPITPFVAFTLLTGCRFSEALDVDWSQIDLDALDGDGVRVGEIRLRGKDTKTHRGRTIGLEVSPMLRSLVAGLKLVGTRTGSVFGLTQGEAVAAAKRLIKEFGAPRSFGWQALRRTCGTFLTNAPGIFGAASAYRSAKQLGHSVTVAEKHYVEVLRGISRDARTLEAAMQIESEMHEAISRLGKPVRVAAR